MSKLVELRTRQAYKSGNFWNVHYTGAWWRRQFHNSKLHVLG